MRLLRSAVTAAILALGSGAGAAYAAAPWSAPIDLGPPSNGSQVMGLGFSERGEGLLGWRLGQSSYVAAVRVDGALGTTSRLPAALVAGPALAVGPPIPFVPKTRRAIVLMQRVLPPVPGASGNDRSRLTWALVAADGTPGRARVLTTTRSMASQVKLAVDWQGNAIAVWRDSGNTRASYRRAGGRFGTPVTIFRGANGQYPDLSAAIAADGRAIVVDAGEVVRARVRTRTGDFGRVMKVGRGDGDIRATAAFSNGGLAIVAWGSQDGGEEADEPWIVRAARLVRGGTRFSAPQTLDAGSGIDRPEGRIAIAFTPGGKATIAWSAVGLQNTFPVMAAAAAHGGRFAQPQQLAPSGAVGGVTVRPDGAAVVVWSQLLGSQQPVRVFASVRPAGAVAFGAPEAVAGPDIAFFPPLAAFDPISGRPTAAWGSRPNPRSPDGVVDDTLVHVATRAAP